MGKWDSIIDRSVLRGCPGCVCRRRGILERIEGPTLVNESVGWCAPRISRGPVFALLESLRYAPWHFCSSRSWCIIFEAWKYG